jgi:hypothetical protein
VRNPHQICPQRIEPFRSIVGPALRLPRVEPAHRQSEEALQLDGDGSDNVVRSRPVSHQQSNRPDVRQVLALVRKGYTVAAISGGELADDHPADEQQGSDRDILRVRDFERSIRLGEVDVKAHRGRHRGDERREARPCGGEQPHERGASKRDGRIRDLAAEGNEHEPEHDRQEHRHSDNRRRADRRRYAHRSTMVAAGASTEHQRTVGMRANSSVARDNVSDSRRTIRWLLTFALDLSR